MTKLLHSWGMNTNPITQLEQFRQEVYHTFDHRADAATELLDALTGNITARSVVELSLAPSFRRTYSSVYVAIGACFAITQPEDRRRREQTLLRLIAAHLAPPERRKFWLFGMDATAIPRIFARTLPDRGFVHCANPIGGNKPITMGISTPCSRTCPPSCQGWTRPGSCPCSGGASRRRRPSCKSA